MKRGTQKVPLWSLQGGFFNSLEAKSEHSHSSAEPW
jgi:hypothetical protein